MKNFTIDQVLIFNPTLKSQKKKPIESDIQQAKVMAFFPVQAQIQQKCNTVGMAEGVFEFCNSLLYQQLRQQTIQTIFMDTCCLILKQFQQNIWIFLKVDFIPEADYSRMGNEQQQTYITNTFTEELLENFINHFYFSFKIFYGKISGYLFLQRLSQLQKILCYFVPKYIEINSYPDKRGLDIMSYLIKNIRAISLDVNSTLKYTYFKNVMQNYDPSVKDLIVFANGLLTFTSLDKTTTQFFAQYLFNTTQPFKFENQKIQQRFRILPEIPLFSSVQKYGTIFNSIVFGFQDDMSNTSIKNSRSSLQISGVNSKIMQSQDLLGMGEQQQIQLLDVFIQKNGQEIKYKLNYFIQKSMVYLTFYKQVSTINQLIFSNRFFHDNSHKFLQKISEVMTTILNQTDIYRFLFVNESTYIGKCTFKDWTTIGKEIKHALITLGKGIQGVVATTFNNHWVYGVKRFNRILILLIPNEVPLHKLQDFSQKMTKQYFLKCFM